MRILSSKGMVLALATAVIVMLPARMLASGGAESESFARGLLSLAIVLIAAKLGTFVHRWKQPMVLGEILAGVVLGNLALVGLDFAEPIRTDEAIGFLSQLGAVILLFQIGLESNFGEMRKVGARAAAVAAVGVIAPFALGVFVAGPLFLPDASTHAHLFLGAALTATSIGITGRVFRDAGAIGSPEARIVLGAAVIDDVLGLLILGVVSSLALQGNVDGSAMFWTVAKAVGFLAGSFVLGRRLAPTLSALFAAIHRGAGMKFAVALAICFAFSYGAHATGLAPIVGAFAAGLLLDPVHFRGFEGPTMRIEVLQAVRDSDEATRQRVESVAGHWNERHLEDLIEPVAHLLVPIFFVVAGFQVRLEVLAEPGILLAVGAITAVAIAGKLASGAAAGPVNRWLVGWGMVPRGEVGLIFALVGHSLGVLEDALLSVIVLVVVLTTLVTPPVLGRLLRTPLPADPLGEPEPQRE